MTASKKASLARGITLLTEIEGQGIPAAKGDRVVYNVKIWLNRGDEVPLNAIQSKQLPEYMIRTVDGETLIDHVATLGRREVIAGIEHSLLGMKAGGYRRVKVSPHLAYREKGLPDLIPAHAVLVVDIWVRDVTVGKNIALATVKGTESPSPFTKIMF